MSVSLPDRLWCMPCLAYNVHAWLDEGSIEFLTHLQAEVAACGQPLLIPPAHSLHSTVAYFLSARSQYERAKDLIWAEQAEAWTGGLAAAVGHLGAFTMTFERIEVSERAVIALAKPASQVDAIRSAVGRLQQEAAIPGRQPDILYVTLARYGDSPVDLPALRAYTSQIDATAATRVEHVVLTEELLYPNLERRILAELALGA